jgi:hypothetical protein
LLETLPPVLPSHHTELSFEEWVEDEDAGDDYPRSA